MSQAAELGLESSEHCVVGVARVAGFVGGNAMILIVSRCQVTRIVYSKAFSGRFHDVTGQTEGCALRPFHFIVHSGSKTEQWKKEKHAEGEDLATRMHRDGRAQHEHRGKQQVEQNKSDDRGRWHGLGKALLLFKRANVR